MFDNNVSMDVVSKDFFHREGNACWCFVRDLVCHGVMFEGVIPIVMFDDNSSGAVWYFSV